MIPIPSVRAIPDALANVTTKLVTGHLADLRPMPRTAIDEGTTRTVYRMEPASGAPTGPPVVLVPPLAAPATCFDLRRGCSLVEHFVRQGRPTYLVDYGEISFGQRHLGIEHWVDEVLPETVHGVAADAESEQVHLVAWCLGGIMSLLALADNPGLPVGSVAAVATPIDMAAVPLLAPVRPLVNLTGGRILTPLYRMLGGAPGSVVGWAYQLAGFDKYVTKPWAIASHLDDREFLAQIEAVDAFMNNMTAYPGRTFGQLYHTFFRSNDLYDGRLALGDRTIQLADVRVPVLVVAGDGDGIAPIRAVRRLTELLDGAPDVRFEICPGGHLGVLTGRGARTTTWACLDGFLAAHAPRV